MKYLAMIQARCGSTRLPNKVLMDLCGKPSLQRVIERVKRSEIIDEVMVITSIDKANLPIIKLCAEIGVRVGIGSEDDVLDRYYQNARLLNPEYVLRLTGDCPCIDHGLIDQAIMQMSAETDYCANTIKPTFADGLDFEIMKYTALERSWHEAVHSFEREHVTQYIIHHPQIFKQQNFESPVGDFSGHRWTVDELEDFEVVSKIYRYFLEEKKKEDFDYLEILDYLGKHPEVAAMNSRYQRNEGLLKSIGEDVIVRLENERKRE